MTTDFRALCAELSDALRNAIRVVYHEDGTQHISTAMPILRRAHAALTDEPAVPKGREPVAVTGQPSDEELALIYHDCCRGCEFMDQNGFENAARRPKPPNLAEEAFELLDRIEKAESVWNMRELDTIRAALERLQELEKGNE